MAKKLLGIIVLVVLFVLGIAIGNFLRNHKPVTSKSNSNRTYRVGILTLKTLKNHEVMVASMKQELEKAGKSIVYEQEEITDSSMFAPVARKYVNDHVDLIVANSTGAVKAATQETTTIPIVFGGVGDPVANGIVSSLDSSETNLTGVSSLSVDLTSKRLDLLHELFPNIKKVYFLHSPDEVASENSRKIIKQSASQEGITLVEKEVHSASDISSVSAALRASEAQAIMLASSVLVWSGQDKYIAAQFREKIPVAGVDYIMAEGGALFSYGPNYQMMGVQIAKMVGNVLDGTPPRFIPIERPARVDFVINQKTADKLGIRFPTSTVLKPDRIIN